MPTLRGPLAARLPLQAFLTCQGTLRQSFTATELARSSLADRAETRTLQSARVTRDGDGLGAALLAEFPDAVIEAEQREISTQEGAETAAVTYIFTANIAAPP